MTTSPILGITEIAAGQTGKYATANAALERLEASANDTLDIDFTSADQTVSLDDFQKHMRLHCINVTTARNLTLQASKRELTVRSSASNTAAVTVKLGTTSIGLNPGQSLKVFTNGTANGLEIVSDTTKQPVKTYTAIAQTLVLADAGSLLLMNNASANHINVPANASVAFPIGTKLAVVQYGAGATSSVPIAASRSEPRTR